MTAEEALRKIIIEWRVSSSIVVHNLLDELERALATPAAENELPPAPNRCNCDWYRTSRWCPVHNPSAPAVLSKGAEEEHTRTVHEELLRPFREAEARAREIVDTLARWYEGHVLSNSPALQDEAVRLIAAALRDANGAAQ